MKKTLIITAMILCMYGFSYAYAGDTIITVTEKIPGGNCKLIEGDSIENRKYECTISSGFAGVTGIIQSLVKYATFIVALLGVLALVVSGIQMSISGIEPKAKDEAKARIEKVIQGLILLFLIGFILNTVAPWIYA